MGIDFEISEEQAAKFAAELFFSTNLTADVKSFILENKEEYERFVKELSGGDS